MLTGRRDFECEAIIWSRQGPVKESHAIIRTILKDLPPSALGDGAILFHEHLSFGADFFERMRPANAPRPATPPPPSYLTRPEIVAEELRAAGKEGLRCIVDGGHVDMGTSYEDQGGVVASSLRSDAHASRA